MMSDLPLFFWCCAALSMALLPRSKSNMHFMIARGPCDVSPPLPSPTKTCAVPTMQVLPSKSPQLSPAKIAGWMSKGAAGRQGVGGWHRLLVWVVGVGCVGIGCWHSLLGLIVGIGCWGWMLESTRGRCTPITTLTVTASHF